MKRLLFIRLIISAFTISGLMAPAAFGQKNEIIALQRDVADLQEKMKGLQKSQDEKFAAIQSMLQQAIDASTRGASGVTSLQREVDSKLNDQQTKLVAPVATLGSKVDQLADEFRAVSTTVVDLRTKVGALDGKLADISNAIRTLSTPAPAAPAPVTPQAPAVPPADTLWESARRDESGGKPEIAIEEYMEYVKNYPDTSRAPEAQYKVGMIYFNAGKNFDDAVKAFDVVIERFPENPKTPEALYYKAVALFRGEHKTESGKVFKEYLARYPRGERVADAHKNLRNLGMERAPSGRK